MPGQRPAPMEKRLATATGLVRVNPSLVEKLDRLVDDWVARFGEEPEHVRRLVADAAFKRGLESIEKEEMKRCRG